MTRLAPPAALIVLDAAARDAGAAEGEFRESYAREIERLEIRRRRAYRRFHFLAALIAADAGAPDREASRAAQKDAAAQELDWTELDGARAETLDAMEALADAVHDERLLTEQEVAEQEGVEADSEDAVAEPARFDEPHDQRAGSLLMALAAFEARFEEMRGRPFAELFDRHMPDTPLVDF